MRNVSVQRIKDQWKLHEEQVNQRGSSKEHAESRHTATPQHQWSFPPQKRTEESGVAQLLLNLEHFSKFIFSDVNFKSLLPDVQKFSQQDWSTVWQR